jgi:ribosome-associated toxin RatA of RatAB toxin-antitoxin module
MGTLTAERTVDVHAPIERCYAIAADLERSPDWQRALQSVTVLERDAQGRPSVVETVSDASVKTITARLAFTYEEPTAIRVTQQKGDLKSLHGGWSFVDLGDESTRVTYALEVDPGRMLGMLLRGPVVDKVRQVLVGDAVDALKVRAESGASAAA